MENTLQRRGRPLQIRVISAKAASIRLREVPRLLNVTFRVRPVPLVVIRPIFATLTVAFCARKEQMCLACLLKYVLEEILRMPCVRLARKESIRSMSKAPRRVAIAQVSPPRTHIHTRSLQNESPFSAPRPNPTLLRTAHCLSPAFDASVRVGDDSHLPPTRVVGGVVRAVCRIAGPGFSNA